MTEKIEKKVIIAAFTKNGRDKLLESKKKQGEKKGWEFVKYEENGMSSYAIFMVQKSNNKRAYAIAAIVLVVFIIYLGSSGEKKGSGSYTMYNISSADLNIRQNPTTDAEVIGILEPNGSIKEVENTNSEWKKVEFDNKTGYVSSTLLGSEKNLKYEEEKRKAEEKACRQDLQCWAEQFTSIAAVYCPEYIEKLANYTHEWTDGVLEPKFSHYRWKNQKQGTVTYIGDKLKFQNGFGAWQNIVYECDIDTVNKTVLYVRAEPGRI